MGQNFINDRALSDGSDDAGPAAAALAMEHVEGKGAFTVRRVAHVMVASGVLPWDAA